MFTEMCPDSCFSSPKTYLSSPAWSWVFAQSPAPAAVPSSSLYSSVRNALFPSNCKNEANLVRDSATRWWGPARRFHVTTSEHRQGSDPVRQGGGRPRTRGSGPRSALLTTTRGLRCGHGHDFDCENSRRRGGEGAPRAPEARTEGTGGSCSPEGAQDTVHHEKPRVFASILTPWACKDQ